MNRKNLIFLVLLLMSASLLSQTIYVVNSQSRTLSKIDTVSDELNNSFALLGNVPNKMLIAENALYVLNSADNTISKYDKDSGANLGNYLIEVGSNPWDLVLYEGYFYITGLISNKVYKMDAGNYQVVGSIALNTAPEALIVKGGKLYVTSAGDYMQNYYDSAISVIDLPSFSLLKSIPLPANPQYLALYGDKLHISCTGNWVDVFGKIVVLDTGNDEIEETLEIGGSPGNIFISPQSIAYVADGGGYAFYSYDADSYELYHPAANPLDIGVSDLAGTASMMALLLPNWGSNAEVRLVNYELENLKNYTVGLMPTDIKIDLQNTSVSDEHSPVLPFALYPNPAKVGSALKIKGEKPFGATLSLYNLRGQLVSKQALNSDESIILPQDSPSGIYFYSIQKGRQIQRGRLILY